MTRTNLDSQFSGPNSIGAILAGAAARRADTPSAPANLEAIEGTTSAVVPKHSDTRTGGNGDTAQALAFLRKWPTAFPHLVAISTNGAIEARAFTSEDLRDGGPVEQWINERQGRTNLYYSVNSLKAPLNKKPPNLTSPKSWRSQSTSTPLHGRTRKRLLNRWWAFLASTTPSRPCL